MYDVINTAVSSAYLHKVKWRQILTRPRTFVIQTGYNRFKTSLKLISPFKVLGRLEQLRAEVSFHSLLEAKNEHLILICYFI